MNQLLTCVMLMPVAYLYRVSVDRYSRLAYAALTLEKMAFWSSEGYGLVMFFAF